MKWLKTIALAAVLATGSTAGASADVIFTFTQSGPIDPRDPESNASDALALFELTVTDEAFSNGLDLDHRNSGDTLQSDLDGVVAFSAGLTNVFRPLVFDLERLLVPYAPGVAGENRIRLTSTPAGLLSGSVFFNNFEHTISFNFDGTSIVTGTITSDNGAVGCRRAICDFTGVQTVQAGQVAVPEPVSASLFGIGLMGLGLVRWKRRAAAI
jgi:hypothetical protein